MTAGVCDTLATFADAVPFNFWRVDTVFLDASTTESVPGLSLLKVERARARPYTCEEACEEAVGCIFLWLGKGLLLDACVCGP